MFYTRYQHIAPPNNPSCNFGSDDYHGLVEVSTSSRHSGGANVLFADGSARFVKDSVAARVWTAMGTIAGFETIEQDPY